MDYVTNIAMLEGIKRGDEISWRDFYEKYRPLIQFIGYQASFDPAEKEELVQNVMTKFFNQQGKFTYDPAKGKFRTYFRYIINSCVCDIRRKKKDCTDIIVDEETMERVPAPPAETAWDKEWEEYALSKVRDELRAMVDEETFQEFDLYAIQKIPVEKVAGMLNRSVSQIYQTKFRLTKKLRTIVRQLLEEE